MKVLPGRLSGIALCAGLLLFGCDSAPNASENKTTVVEQTEHVFELQCRESAQFLAVDPAIARTYVPPGYSVFVSGQETADMSRRLPDGSAVLIMIYQECSEATWDGVPLAPLKMVHQWVRIDGPLEVLPVPGTSTTVPTYYWYMLDDPTTDTGLRQRLREAGVSSSSIVSIELGDNVDSKRTGGVVEKDNPGTENDVGYSFVEINRPAEKSPIGINHRLFHEQCDDNGRCTLMKALDSGFIVPFGSGSAVTVTAHPDSWVARLWGTTTFHGIASQFEHMEFKVGISSGIPLPERSEH